LDETLAGVYKGVEVNLADGDVSDTNIKSGINQLRYALPDLIGHEIWNSTIGHPIDSVPFIVVAILVTTAEIFVANDTFTMEAVKKAKSLEELADKEDFVVFYSIGGPDFDSHRNKVLLRFKTQYGLSDKEPLLEERARVLNSEKSAFLRRNPLADGFSSENFTHFVICSFDKLSHLIEQLKAATENDVKNQKLVFSKEQFEKIKSERVKTFIHPE
jgi:hypothetical protein